MLQSSTGEIGTLHLDGRQVGGFLDWEITVATRVKKKGDLKAAELTEWKAIAKRFWLLEELTDGQLLEAVFYCFDGRDLKQVSRNKIDTNLSWIRNINETISAPLVMLHG